MRESIARFAHRTKCKDGKRRRKVVTSPARERDAPPASALAMKPASSGMSPAFMPQRTISGVPSLSPFTSPSTGAIGRPMPQVRMLACRSVFAAAWPPP